MLIRFLSRQANFAKYSLSTICSNYMKKSNQEASKQLNSAWQEDIKHIMDLFNEKKYEEALKEISKIEDKYPGCSKMIQTYRGKIGVALLNESGELKKLKPSI